MRGVGATITGVVLVLAACGRPAVPPASSAAPNRPAVVAPTDSAGTAVAASPSPTFCAGRSWPPYPIGPIAGLTARSVDRATVEITNHTAKTIYYRVSGWQPDQFETCRALGEIEVQRGPLDPGATERVMIDPGWQQSGVPVTVAVWDRPCGEACSREPVRAMDVPLSPLEPAAS